MAHEATAHLAEEGMLRGISLTTPPPLFMVLPLERGFPFFKTPGRRQHALLCPTRWGWAAVLRGAGGGGGSGAACRGPPRLSFERRRAGRQRRAGTAARGTGGGTGTGKGGDTGHRGTPLASPSPQLPPSTVRSKAALGRPGVFGRDVGV